MPLSVTIRAAVERDLPEIAALAAELGYPTTAETMAQRFELVTASSDDAVLVAEVDGRCSAWIHVMRVVSLESDEHAEIRGVVVADRLRGSGVGSALVRAAEQWAIERGYTRIRVRSNVTRHRTHGFYLDRGFTVEKEQKVFEKKLDARA